MSIEYRFDNESVLIEEIENQFRLEARVDDECFFAIRNPGNVGILLKWLGNDRLNLQLLGHRSCILVVGLVNLCWPRSFSCERRFRPPCKLYKCEVTC